MASEKAGRLAKRLGELARKAQEEKVCYRVIRDPSEVDLWIKHGGWNSKESFYKRFVCTANPRLSEAKKHLFSGGFTIKVENVRGIKCPDYYTHALTRKKVTSGFGTVQHAYRDFIAFPDDVVLAECFTTYDVPLSSIGKVMVPKDLDRETREAAERLAKAAGAELVSYEEEFGEPLHEFFGFESEEELREALREVSRNDNLVADFVWRPFLKSVLTEKVGYEKAYDYVDEELGIPFSKDTLDFMREYSHGLGLEVPDMDHLKAVGRYVLDLCYSMGLRKCAWKLPLGYGDAYDLTADAMTYFGLSEEDVREVAGKYMSPKEVDKLLETVESIRRWRESKKKRKR